MIPPKQAGNLIKTQRLTGSENRFSGRKDNKGSGTSKTEVCDWYFVIHDIHQFYIIIYEISVF